MMKIVRADMSCFLPGLFWVRLTGRVVNRVYRGKRTPFLVQQENAGAGAR